MVTRSATQNTLIPHAAGLTSKPRNINDRNGDIKILTATLH